MSNRGRHRKTRKYGNTWLYNVLSDKEIDLIFKRAEEQGNRITTNMIEYNPTASDIFIWDHTPEGWAYWNNILFNQVQHYKMINNL